MKPGAALPAVLWLAASLAAGGCAHLPQPVTPLDLRSLEVRYGAQLRAREALLDGTVADCSLWLETAEARYPGAHGTVGLGGPRTMRLRIASAFGTAVDAGAIGDSVFVYVPARRTAVRAAAADPPLAFRRAADFCVRAVSAAWAVPPAAWTAARNLDSLRVVQWTEAGDTLEAAIGSSGLPRWVRRARAGMSDVRVTYLAYGAHEDAAWPIRFEVADDGGRMRLSVRVRRIVRNAGADPARFRPELPADANVLRPEDLMQWIEEELLP